MPSKFKILLFQIINTNGKWRKWKLSAIKHPFLGIHERLHICRGIEFAKFSFHRYAFLCSSEKCLIVDQYANFKYIYICGRVWILNNSTKDSSSGEKKMPTFLVWDLMTPPPPRCKKCENLGKFWKNQGISGGPLGTLYNPF